MKQISSKLNIELPILTLLGEDVLIWQSNLIRDPIVSGVLDVDCNNCDSYEINHPMEGVNGDIRFNLLGYYGLAINVLGSNTFELRDSASIFT